MTTTRRPIVAGNWKMNTTVPEATVLAAAVRTAVDGVHGVEVVVCPPAVSLVPVHAVLDGSDVGLGAQILKDLGVSSIRLRSSSAKPRAFVGLSGFGIEITAVEPLE